MKAMQKRIMTCLLVVFMAMSLIACGRVKAAADVLMGKETEEENEEVVEVTEDEEPVEEEEPTAEPQEKKSTSDYPMLGQEDIQDFDGYTYLYCELLRTESTKNEKTGKMESFELPVFIPLDEYVYVNRNCVSGNKLGVEYKVSLEPSVRYDAEDYLMTENLDYYLEQKYDPYYADRYKDVVLGKSQEAGKNAALATVEYCYYEKYDDTYTPTFCTYYLTELESGVEVLVEIEVNASEVTGKTPELIDELETFYPFEINWDADKAAKKLEDYLASGGENSFSTGYLLFDLPDGWAQDDGVGDYDHMVYAPGGDVDVAGCFVSILKEYVGYGYAEDAGVLTSEDLLVEAVKSMIAEEDMDAEVTYYGDTCLGKAAVASAKISTDDGQNADTKMYFIFDDSYMYMITSSQLPDAADNAETVAQDILENGQVRE